MFQSKYLVYLSTLAMAVLVFLQCDSNPVLIAEDQSYYWGHGDSVEYVGIMKCASCHGDIYKSFIQTGMGMSLAAATPEKSSADLSHHPILYDSILNFQYTPLWKNDSLYLREYRLDGEDTVHNLIIKADYVVGSGQHTNSHLYHSNNYYMQMPFTWYAQEGRLDFPPGYEGGNNSRFERTIGLECMSCHNAMPVDFVMGSENKFERIAEGIDCERCHGPGGAHVRKIISGDLTDTSQHIDYSIVNPKKLTTQLQFELCSRCHLQGNSVLAPGKSFFDFKPGMTLNSTMDVYLPRYNDDEENFIMASHVDRFKMSKCFQEGDGKFVCTSCHNPHVSVKLTGKQVFDETCKSCHSGNDQIDCSAPMADRLAQEDYCNGCHMPKSGSIDIPHVTVHDHYIRKPKSTDAKQVTAVKKFLGLVAVNNANPTLRSKIRAYLQQYEKFGGASYLLDTAERFLKGQPLNKYFHENIQLFHLKGTTEKIIAQANSIGKDSLLSNFLTSKSYDNEHAWTSYRIGEAYLKVGSIKEGKAFISRAVALAPYILDFQNKLAGISVRESKWGTAQQQYHAILEENPNHIEALANLGYVHMRLGEWEKAEDKLGKALYLRPDYELALLNLGLLYLQQDKVRESQITIERLLRLNPNNQEAIQLLTIINQKQ